MQASTIFGVVLATTVAVTGCASRSSVRELTGQLHEHGQRVDGISGRVDTVGRRVDDLDGRVGQLSRHHHLAGVVDSFDVRFGFARADLDDRGMTRLAELAHQLREDGRLTLELHGFTDPRGPRDYNVALAQRRVESVRRYLVQRGVPAARIAAIGLGALDAKDVKNPDKRRVTVQITMPETMVLAATPGSDAAAAAPATRDREPVK